MNSTVNQAHPDAALRELLKDRPLLRLTLQDRAYGTPGPDDRWQVEAAINGLLKPARQGMVLFLDVLELEDGSAEDVLVIGVVDLDVALPRLRKLLYGLGIPAGATLVVEGSEENLVPDLPTRDELVRQATDALIGLVLAECIASTPRDWQGGLLAVQCDGSWLGYQLTNAQSDNPARISERLKALCEELTVLMWNNGNRWREAVLRYEGREFSTTFSYEEPVQPIPSTPVAAPSKPWWKFR